MPILPVLSAASQEVCLNQAYNVANEIDDNDVPPECRLYQHSMDNKPFDLDDERDDYESVMHRVYVQGVRSVRLS